MRSRIHAGMRRRMRYEEEDASLTRHGTLPLV
jgi:hypothetical protein